MTNVSIAAGALLHLLRYQVQTPDYFTGSANVAGSGTDYYKLYNQVFGYGYAGMCSVLALSHTLAWLLGIGIQSDTLIWMTFYVFLFPLLNLVGGVLAMLAYDNAYTVSQDTTSSYQSTALALMTTIQNEMAGIIVLEASRHMEFYMNQNNWLYAHYYALDDEGKKMYRENEMFQWQVLRMGIPIWNLMDEAGTGRKHM